MATSDPIGDGKSSAAKQYGQPTISPRKRAKTASRTALALEPDAFTKALEQAGPRPADDSMATGPKIAYATKLSGLFARAIRDGLAARHPQPFATAKAGEETYGGKTGGKKIDVLFATDRLGLALDVSIKTQSFAGFETKMVKGKPQKVLRSTKAYAHNPTRIIDQELVIEAKRCHQLSPRAVMIGVLFFPADACIDANTNWADKTKRKPSDCSSVAEFAQRLRHITNRSDVRDPDQEARFEAIYIAVYGLASSRESRRREGEPVFFDVTSPIRRFGLPDQLLDFAGFLDAVMAKYSERFETRREFHEYD